MNVDTDQQVEDRSDATETQLAASLQQALFNASPTDYGPAGLSPLPWPSILDSAIGLGLLMYAARVGTQFGAAAHLDPTVSASLVDRTSKQIKNEAVSALADQAQAIYDAAQSEPGHVEAYRRLRVGSAQLAREAATWVREGLRHEMAQQIGAAAPGIDVLKTWRTRRDARVRPAHGELEGVSVPLGDRFSTHLGPISYPTDPTAAPALIYGCRCHLSYRVPAKAVHAFNATPFAA